MTKTGRWEWRTFSRDLGSIGPKPEEGGAMRPVTRERYILSLASVHNVKIRDNCLDIKTLLQTDALGLEQWEPTLKAEFPIDETALDAAWSAWGFPHPVVQRTRCSLEEFLGEVVPGEPGLRVVEIEKHRTPLVLAGCPGERAVLTVGNEKWESISFEHVNQYRVWRAVRALGLENAGNTNYPAMLKRIAGFEIVETPRKMENV